MREDKMFSFALPWKCKKVGFTASSTYINSLITVITNWNNVTALPPLFIAKNQSKPSVYLCSYLCGVVWHYFVVVCKRRFVALHYTVN